jgi:hypothetical protein
MVEFLQIIYYVVQSIWPIFFLAFLYLIWKDVNRIAAHFAPEYYYEDEDEEADEEEEPENGLSKVETKHNDQKIVSPADDEFIVEDLEL